MEDIEVFAAQCPKCGKETFFLNSNTRITACSACGQNFSAGTKKTPKELGNISTKCYCKNKLSPCGDNLTCLICQQTYPYAQYTEKKIDGKRIAKIPSISDDELKLRLIEYITDGDYTKEDFAERLNFENAVKVMIPVDLYKSRFKVSWQERINRNNNRRYVNRVMEGEASIGVTLTSKIQHELMSFISYAASYGQVYNTLDAYLNQDAEEVDKETEIKNLKTDDIQLLPIDINPEDEYKNKHKELIDNAVKKYVLEGADKKTYINITVEIQATKHYRRLYYPFLIAPIEYQDKNAIYQTAAAAFNTGRCGGDKAEYISFKKNINKIMNTAGLISVSIVVLMYCLSFSEEMPINLMQKMSDLLLFVISPILLTLLGSLYYYKYYFISSLKKKRLIIREKLLRQENLLYLIDVNDSTESKKLSKKQ